MGTNLPNFTNKAVFFLLTNRIFVSFVLFVVIRDRQGRAKQNLSGS